MIESLSTFVIALLLTFSAIPQAVRAEMIFGGYGGVGTGALERSGPEKLTTYPVQAFIGYEFWKLSIRGIFQHTELGYTHNNEKFKGIHSVSGVGLSYSGAISELGRATILIEKPLEGSLILLSESAGQVNDFSYSQSTLVTFSGQDSITAMVGYEFTAMGKGMLRRGGNVYYGIFMSYLKHSFSTQTTRIKTNNSLLGPISPGTEPSTASLTFTSLLFSGTYDL